MNRHGALEFALTVCRGHPRQRGSPAIASVACVIATSTSNGVAGVVEADPTEVSQTALGEVVVVVRGGCS